MRGGGAQDAADVNRRGQVEPVRNGRGGTRTVATYAALRLRQALARPARSPAPRASVDHGQGKTESDCSSSCAFMSVERLRAGKSAVAGSSFTTPRSSPLRSSPSDGKKSTRSTPPAPRSGPPRWQPHPGAPRSQPLEQQPQDPGDKRIIADDPYHRRRSIIHRRSSLTQRTGKA